MSKPKAFTIIELLVVVAIIAILIGILLPAIGRARDSAFTTRSQANLRQVVIAHASYAADHNDNQWTPTPHGLATYGSDLTSMINAYNAKHDPVAPHHNGMTICVSGSFCLEIGWASKQGGANTLWYWGGGGSNHLATPINFGNKNGYYVAFQVRSFNHYLSNRFYDPVWYAPKDRIMIQEAAECYDAPGEFCIQSIFYIANGTYILSPAALYTPDLFSKTSFTEAQSYQMPALFRVPTFAQARYPDLKTHMLERNWLQGPPSECNPHIPPPNPPTGYYCRPYRFNGGLQSKPVTLFYDGHIDLVSVSEALDANQQAIMSGGQDESLWHHKTPWGDAGWFHEQAYSPPTVTPKFGSPGNNTSSFHILTRHGILGRDTLSQ